MKTVIIDNYDSFTYNLYHLVREAGMEADVLRNDAFRLEDLEAYDKIILSPGPGIPQEAGLLPDVIRTFAGRKPMLGVCLGHQAIGEAFGARLTNLSEVYHGVQTPCFLTGEDYIFRGLPRQFPGCPAGPPSLSGRGTDGVRGRRSVYIIHILQEIASGKCKKPTQFLPSPPASPEKEVFTKGLAFAGKLR